MRVTVLKGRPNYLCWRALKLCVPAADAGGAEHLAFASLCAFALGDPDGDLDRWPRRAPLAAVAADAWRGASDRLLRRVRCAIGCCSVAADREACGALAARRRAERAHVVLTNHAFALARREFFRHLVFDECEHLHDVAHDAFSHTVSLPALADLLDRHRGADSAEATGPVARVEREAVPKSEAWEAAVECGEHARRGLRAGERLADEVVGFRTWRDARRRERADEDAHSLFREYAFRPDAEELVRSQAELLEALKQLATGVTRLLEHVDTVPTRGLHALRRALELYRADLEDLVLGVDAWLPRAGDGSPEFRDEVFHDVESPPSGGEQLVARVLLPHEVLGRRYYPDLSGAVLCSATTWLKGGFDAAATYLGVARAHAPAPDEEREPTPVRTFRAPEAFDYGRVLVAVPRDAPTVRDKDAWLDYVGRFVAWLAERTRGRLLVLFTNADDLTRVGTRLEPFFAARNQAFWYQRMDGTAKEELGELFRSHTDSVLLGLDTFWYGADFPGQTLEYLVLVRLPYGVPDRYHHAQCAVLGTSDQRRQIYMPRALAKFRQGFGRLMRRESDRGVVFVLDRRVLDPRHRVFLGELPLRRAAFEEAAAGEEDVEGARYVTADTERCLREALAHMEMGADVRRRGLDVPFAGWSPEGERGGSAPASRAPRAEERPVIRPEDVPY